MNFNILQFLDLSTKKLFWVFLFCCFLFGLPMLVPEKILATLGLDTFLDANRSWLGGLFLFAFVGLLTTGAARSLKWIGNNWLQRQARKKREVRLRHLSPTERGVLHPFLVTNRRTLSLVEDGTKDDLAESSILLQVSQRSGVAQLADYEMSAWAWKYLKVHPQFGASEKDAYYEVPGFP